MKRTKIFFDSFGVEAKFNGPAVKKAVARDDFDEVMRLAFWLFHAGEALIDAGAFACESDRVQAYIALQSATLCDLAENKVPYRRLYQLYALVLPATLHRRDLVVDDESFDRMMASVGALPKASVDKKALFIDALAHVAASMRDFSQAA